MSVMSIVPVNAYETFGGSWSDTNVRDLDWKVKSGIDYYYDIGDAASGAQHLGKTVLNQIVQTSIKLALDMRSTYLTTMTIMVTLCSL